MKQRPSVMSSCSSISPHAPLVVITPFSFQVVCHFQTLLPFSQRLSLSVCLSLSLTHTNTHSHINRESYHWPTGTHYFCDPRLLYGGLVLKMGIYCSPPDKSCECAACVLFIQSAVCLVLFGKRQTPHAHAVCVCMCVCVFMFMGESESGDDGV